ncbi:MAG: HDOD domain-containing protein [Methylophilaceae bacterium]|nr:HDOD domain-containing protein [Methylophilaceae bacterium]
MIETIGRFEIIRLLGKGGQGAVYLARDTHLDRLVAIKTLRPGSSELSALLSEARTVSKLQHPNIVTLFDAGEFENAPYLVYAYVEGQTLAQLLARETTLPLARAAQLTCSLLDAIGHAHRQGVMHLDLKPANVMITSSGNPLIMDFGLARCVGQPLAEPGKIKGTPHYIAPEILQGKPPTPRSDLFSIGMMLYEMVTGKPAVDSDNVYEILHRTANETATPPSARNVRIDERLEAIILKAIAKNPEERYADAAAMRHALELYLDPTREALPATGSEHGTLEFLLRRMRSKSDFPALSSTISNINKIVDSESESASKLTKCILQDFALTNKLLRLVNTASYGQFGGKINTISKAVVILGFETVRNVAMTLILMEFMQNKAQASQLMDDVLGSYFAGVIAAQLTGGHHLRDTEEAMICSMFRNLGKLLATFYLFEESQEVARLVEQGESEDRAALKVLGITYDDLGIGVAKSWNFPDRLIAGMQKLTGEKIRKPRNELESLTVTVNLANDLCAVAGTSNPSAKTEALKKLAKRYGDAMPVSEQELEQALQTSLHELAHRASILDLHLAHSPLMSRIKTWSGVSLEKRDEPSPVDERMAGITQLDLHTQSQEALTDEHDKPDPEAILSAGIQDVTNALVEEYKLNDILQMVLETMHRGMGFNRTLILVRDAQNNQMVARFGFGRDSDAVLRKFRFPLGYRPDVFHLAMEKGVDIVIEDVMAENIRDKIPTWYREAVTAQSFLLLPVMIKDRAIGLFYADMEQANAMQVTPKQLSLLRTLRNQAVLAIRQQP